MTPTLIDQLRAERAAEHEAAAVAHRRRGIEQFMKYRTEGELERLATTDAARIAAERVLNDARRENLAAERAIAELTKEDGASLFFRNLSPHLLTPAARKYVQRGRASQEAIGIAREAVQKAIAEHNRAVAEVDFAAAARRRAAKIAAGQMGTKGGA